MDQLDPGKLIEVVKGLTVTSVLVAVILGLLKGWIVPGQIYRRALADIDLKDQTIDRVTASNERLTRSLTKNNKGAQ